MNALKQFALACCILCTLGGVVRIFWPTKQMRTVINAALALYILASVLSFAKNTDWSAWQAEIASWSRANAVQQNYQEYAASVGSAAAEQALQKLLLSAGIDATVSVKNDRCSITAKNAQDARAARRVLSGSLGDLPCEIRTGEDEQ